MKKSLALRIAAWTFGVLAAVSLILTILLPTLVSTDWGKRQLLKIANNQIPGQISANKINLSWFGQQQVEGLELRDPQGVLVANANEMILDSPLTSFLFHGFQNGSVEVNGLNLKLIEEPNGLTNLQKAIGTAFLGERNQHPDSTLVMTLANVNAKFELPKENTPIKVSAHGQTQQGNVDGHFNVDAILLGDQWSALRPSDLNIQVHNFPVAILDHLLGVQYPKMLGLVSKTLGETLDVTLQQVQKAGNLNFDIRAHSETLTAHADGIIQNDMIILNKPGIMTLAITPELISQLFNATDMNIPVNLMASTKAELVIDKMSMPLSFLSHAYQENANPSSISAKLSLAPTVVQTNVFPDAIALRSFQVNVEALEQAPTMRIQIHGDAQQQGEPIRVKLDATMNKPKHLGTLIEDFKKHTTVETEFDKGLVHGEVKGVLQLNIEQKWEIWPLNTHIKSDVGSIDVTGKLSEGMQFWLTSPAQVNYAVPAHLFETNKLAANSPNLSIQINPSNDPLNLKELSQRNFANVRLTGTATLSDMQVSRKNAVNTVVLQELKLPWKVDGPLNHIIVSLLGKASLQQNYGNFKGEAHFTDWLNVGGILDLTQAKSNSKIAAEKLPTILIEAIIGYDDLDKWLGDTITTTVHAELQNLIQPSGSVDIDLEGDQLTSRIPLKLEGAISLNNAADPITLQATLTPSRFQVIRSLFNADLYDDSLVLLQSGQFAATIKELHFPWQDNEPISVDALFTLDKISVTDAPSAPLILEDINMRVQSQDLARSMTFRVEGKDISATNTLNPLVISGTIDNFLDAEDRINTQDLSISLEARSKYFPAGLLCQFACYENLRYKLEALLGKKIDTDIYVRLHRMNGPLRVKLEGENGWIFLDGQLTNGTLTLNQPFQAEIAVTPELTQSILQEVIPIMGGAIGGESPIKIEVSPEGFALPIHNLNEASIEVGRASLDLGKMSFNNDAQLGTVFALLKPADNEPLSVWFTPLYFSVSQGRIKLQRMDMLALNRFPLALWGRVNMVKDTVDMRIGITGIALRHAFSIRNIEDDYMMQLPFTGSLHDASIDKAKATGRISALIAQSHGGTQGLIIGTVLGIASGNLTEEAPPAPTTQPFPWEK